MVCMHTSVRAIHHSPPTGTPEGLTVKGPNSTSCQWDPSNDPTKQFGAGLLIEQGKGGEPFWPEYVDHGNVALVCCGMIATLADYGAMIIVMTLWIPNCSAALSGSACFVHETAHKGRASGDTVLLRSTPRKLWSNKNWFQNTPRENRLVCFSGLCDKFDNDFRCARV